MRNFLVIAIAFALIIWLFRPTRLAGPRPRALPAPEDDITTPIDKDELEAAERELEQDRGARALGEDPDAEDDWGPGTR